MVLPELLRRWWRAWRCRLLVVLVSLAGDFYRREHRLEDGSDVADDFVRLQEFDYPAASAIASVILRHPCCCCSQLTLCKVALVGVGRSLMAEVTQLKRYGARPITGASGF